MQFFKFYILLLILFGNSICDNEKIQTKEITMLIKKVIEKAFPDCYSDLQRIQAHKRDLSNYGSILGYIGKGVNDLGDEIECRYSFNGTRYVIAKLKKSNLELMIYAFFQIFELILKIGILLLKI